MPSPVEPIALGDYVHVNPTADVWVVVRLDGARALLSPSSIALAGRPRRVAAVTSLTVVRAGQDIDDAF